MSAYLESTGYSKGGSASALSFAVNIQDEK